MKKKKIIVISLLLFIFVIIPILFFFQSKHIIFNYFIDHSDFTTSDNKVYFSNQLDKASIDELTVVVDSAISRNNKFWGRTIKNYQIIFCATDDELKKYSNGSSTVSFSTPIGNYIIIKESNASIDIVSHELCHLYLWEKIGFWNKRKLPVWFDEGVAMQLDYRDYMCDSVLENNYKTEITRLKKISSVKGFYSSRWDSLRIHYIISKCEIRDRIKKYGITELHKQIELIAQGEEVDR